MQDKLEHDRLGDGPVCDKLLVSAGVRPAQESQLSQKPGEGQHLVTTREDGEGMVLRARRKSGSTRGTGENISEDPWEQAALEPGPRLVRTGNHGATTGSRMKRAGHKGRVEGKARGRVGHTAVQFDSYTRGGDMSLAGVHTWRWLGQRQYINQSPSNL